MVGMRPRSLHMIDKHPGAPPRSLVENLPQMVFGFVFSGGGVYVGGADLTTEWSLCGGPVVPSTIQELGF